MARIHLNVKFPFEKTQDTVMRFGKKSNRKEICDHISEKLNDPTFKNAEIVVRQNNGIKQWMDKESTLKSLGVESDMSLIIFRNPVRYNFEYKSKNYETSFSPKQTISQIVGCVAESASVIYYLGYSLIPVFQGKPSPVYEDLLLCDQITQFDKILFRIKYYTILPGDTESGVPLSRTYSLTRDYLLTGFSPLTRKEYINLCAMVAVIECGDDLDQYLLDFDSAYFLRYLPEKLKTDLNSEDDLFDQIQLIEREDSHLMKEKFVAAARSSPNFGYQGFDVQYSIDDSELTYIHCCVGYDYLMFLDKSTMTCVEKLDIETLTYEIDIEGVDQLIINEKYQIAAYSEQILEIESLIKGYKTLKSKLIKIQKLDSKLESTIYNHTIENDLNFLLKIPESVMKVITPSFEFFFISQMFEKLNSQFNSATLNSIGGLYFVSSEKKPDFGDLILPTSFNLTEKGNFLLDMLGIISLEIRSGATSLFDLSQKYGNELRSTVFIVHMMKKQGIDPALCDDIMISYKMISTNLRVEVTISKLKGLCVLFLFPSFAYEQIIKFSKSVLTQIEDSLGNENNDEYIKIYKHLKVITEEIFNVFTEFLNNKDPLKSYDDPKRIINFIQKISYYVPILALINELISFDLSSILQYLDYIKVIQTIFPAIPFKVSDLTFSIERIIRASDRFYHSISDVQMRSRLFFIYDVISLLESLMPKYNQHFIQKDDYDELVKILIKYYSDFLALNVDPLDENSIIYAVVCYSTLLTLWKLRMIPSQNIYQDKIPSNVEKPKKVKPKIPRVRLPKTISPEDEVDISKEIVDKLNLNLSEDTNSAINLQDFLDDMNKMDPKIASLFSLLEKWQPLIQTANRSDPLFDLCRKNYEFALKILRANAERQSRYQPISILFLKIKHHVQFVKCKAVDKFNKSISGISEKSFVHFENVDKIPIFKTLLTEVSNLQNQDIYTKSLIIVLQKFINYFEPFKDEKYTLGQIIEIIDYTLILFNNIFVKIICSHYDDNLKTIILTLVYKIMDLQEIRNNMIKKVINQKAILKYSKKVIEINKRITSLSILLSDRIFKEDGEQFFVTLSICCWRIMHAKLEEHHRSRLPTLLSEASEQLKNMADLLQDKMFKGTTIPQEIIALLRSKSNEVTKFDNTNLLISLIDDLSTLYEKKKFWDVTSQVNSLIATFELAICKLTQKPYIHIFIDQNSPGLQILLQSTLDDSNDSDDNLSSACSSNLSSDMTDSKSSEESSSFPSSEFVSNPASTNNSKKGKQMTFRTMSTLTSFSNSLIRISQSDPHLGNITRPGILLDPLKVSRRVKQSLHVTFDLCKDHDSPIFSTSLPPSADDSTPSDFVPNVQVKKWNFISWNIPEYVKKINIADKLPEIKVKKRPKQQGKKGAKRFESFSHLTFDIIKLPNFKDNTVSNNTGLFGSYGSFMYSYSTAEKAIEDIELLLTQSQTCENLLRKMRNSSLSERFFFILDWISTITTIPMKVSAAKKYDIPQTEELVQLYNTIKNELDMIIDDLKIFEFQTIIESVRKLLLFLDLTKFGLQRAENDLVQIDLNLKDVVSSWKIYTEEVYDTFQKLIEIDEPMVVIFMRQFLESVFNTYVKFQVYADEIDRETKRQIMTIIQCQLCLQLRCILTNIKRMELKEGSTIFQIQADIKALDEKIKEIDFFDDLKRILNEISEASEKRFLFEDADWFSLQLKFFIDSKFSDLEQIYNEDPDSIKITIFYQIISLRHNLLLMRFNEVQMNKSTFMVEMEKVLEKLKSLSQEFSYASSTRDPLTTRKIVEKWHFFFGNAEEEFKELSSVAILMLNSTNRLKSALKYLKKIGSEFIKIENKEFPINVHRSYIEFVNAYTVLIDYVLNKLSIGYSEADMPLDYDKLSVMPSIKVTPFVNSYKSYFSKVQEYMKGKDPNSEPVLLLHLFLMQLKSFSRKFGGSYLSINETIKTIYKSMKKVLNNLSNPKFKELVLEQENSLNLLRMKDDSPICSAEIKILQSIVLYGELIVALISYNLDFLLTSTSTSALISQLVKSANINFDCSFMKNGLSFKKGKFEIFTKQVELFKLIKHKSKQELIIENPFGFTNNEKAKLSRIKINEIPNSASISSVVRAHQYLISKFSSIFIFNSNSKFLKELNKFAANASVYFGFYHTQQNVVLLERTNQIVTLFGEILNSFDSINQFRKVYFEILKSADVLKEKLDQLNLIDQEETKSAKIEKVLSFINTTGELIKKNKTKSVFGPLFDFISSLNDVSRLRLRLNFDLHDMIGFFFVITDLTENSETVQVKDLQLLLQILMKTNLPIAEELCDKIATFIDNHVE